MLNNGDNLDTGDGNDNAGGKEDEGDVSVVKMTMGQRSNESGE